MADELRKSGLDVLGDIAWGTHLCQFYETKQDLLDILVPYFRAGLEDNEFCMWITSEPLDSREAEAALREAVPDFERYLERGQIEIIPHSEWYLKGGSFDLQRVLDGWIDKLNRALASGYDGLRVTGNTAWLEKKDWKSFTDYEEAVNSAIGQHRMLAICTYLLERCSANEIIDVVSNHQFALIRREGEWALIESSQLKWAQEAAKENKQKFWLLFEAKVIGAFIIDAETRKVVLANEAAARIYGFDSPEEVIGKNPLDFASAEEKPRVAKIIAEDMFEKDLRQLNDFRTISRDGREVWISAVGMRTEYEGRLAGLIVFMDITERKQVEQALRESEQRYRLLLESVNEPIMTTDSQGRILTWNKGAETTFGYSAEEIIGKPVTALWPESHRDRFPDAIETMAQSAKAAGIRKTFEAIGRRKDGSEFPAELSLSSWESGGEILFTVIVRDVTEQKRAERERRELEQRAHLASRLAAVGEMAAGIAHEINNPLTSVIGFADLLMRKKLPEDVMKDLKIVNDSARRVGDIVRRLLTFARQYRPERSLVNINEVIENTLQMRAYELETGSIKVITELDLDLPVTMADAGQLQQVFLNLIINAEHEMTAAHGRGNLLIKTEGVDNTIRISFKDDGPGIPKENLERIFEPFFTTRRVGEGTGLGLSLCHGIISDHNGRIYAESEPGKGATFIVELPVVSKEKEVKPAESEVVEAREAATARILVVDDEPAITQFLKRVLIDEGYEVKTIDNAEAALKLIESERYSLILLDIKLPGMSGFELYEHLDKLDKSLTRRVAFITGDVLATNTKNFLSRTRAPYFTKPFDIDRLKREIKRLLTRGE